jgi:hypothetical protein
MRSFSNPDRDDCKLPDLDLIPLICISRTTHSTRLDVPLIPVVTFVRGFRQHLHDHVSGSARLRCAGRTDWPTVNLGLMGRSAQ